MKVLEEKRCLCPNCMEEHEIYIVEVEETNIFKGEEVTFLAQYHYCNISDEYYEMEDQLSNNDISMKDAYRVKKGLLSSNDIFSIRQKYGVSQSDLAFFLGWGEKTITRYEGHQVQDVAHDSILRKIDRDPEWYLELLESFQKKKTLPSYQKYRDTALLLFEKQKDEYLKKSIQAAYAKYDKLDECNGYTVLDLNKVVDVIRYFSNSAKVKSLYKVKLMKLLWYSDALSFKNRTKSITGLVYKSLPLGAVPIAYDLLIDLSGIKYEEIAFDEMTGYHFISDGSSEFSSLSYEERDILDKVIEHFGNSTGKEIVDSMHKEAAYKETAAYGIIQYHYTKQLSI